MTCVWSVRDMALELPAGAIPVRRFSLRYYYYLFCAQILVQNGEFSPTRPIHRGQTYINTQHGTPLKLMGTDLSHKSPNVYSDSYGKTTRWTYLVSPNRYSTEIFRRVYRYDGPVLEVGYPRNDLFFTRNSPDEVARLKKRWGLPLNKKVILYAPTWRDIGTSRVDRDFQLQLDLAELRRRLGNEYVVVLRLHHLISSHLELTDADAGFAFNCSSAQYDAQELMLAADVLVTDYSSMMFDFANLRRPMIFFAYDFDEYSTSIRGTYFDLRAEGPGPVVHTMPELLRAIEGISRWLPEYAERERTFRDKFCATESGNASRTVVEQLILPILEDS